MRCNHSNRTVPRNLFFTSLECAHLNMVHYVDTYGNCESFRFPPSPRAALLVGQCALPRSGLKYTYRNAILIPFHSLRHKGILFFVSFRTAAIAYFDHFIHSRQQQWDRTVQRIGERLLAIYYLSADNVALYPHHRRWPVVLRVVLLLLLFIHRIIRCWNGQTADDGNGSCVGEKVQNIKANCWHEIKEKKW